MRRDSKTTLRVQLPDGKQQTFAGREAWALRHLINAGATGITTIDHPAPRFSHYLYRLRKAGLVITTDYEPHKGDFPGTHGRYKLETPVTVIDGGVS
jgi:hypothetical protein